MKLTPLDIHHKEFHRAMRGYNEEEVDKFLDEVAEEFERLFKENIDLKEQVEKAKEKASQFESMQMTLQNALITAQKSADEVMANAQKNAEELLKEAREKAEDLIEEAREGKGKLEDTFIDLKKAESDFRDKFRAMLESYMCLVEGEIREEVPVAERAVEETVAEEFTFERDSEVPVYNEQSAEGETEEPKADVSGWGSEGYSASVATVDPPDHEQPGSYPTEPSPYGGVSAYPEVPSSEDATSPYLASGGFGYTTPPTGVPGAPADGAVAADPAAPGETGAIDIADIKADEEADDSLPGWMRREEESSKSPE